MPARPARRGSVSGAPCRRLVTARDGTACLEKRAGCGPGRCAGAPARPTRVDACGPPDIFLRPDVQVPACCPWPAAAGV